MCLHWFYLSVLSNKMMIINIVFPRSAWKHCLQNNVSAQNRRSICVAKCNGRKAQKDIKQMRIPVWVLTPHSEPLASHCLGCDTIFSAIKFSIIKVTDKAVMGPKGKGCRKAYTLCLSGAVTNTSFLLLSKKFPLLGVFTGIWAVSPTLTSPSYAKERPYWICIRGILVAKHWGTEFTHFSHITPDELLLWG